MELLRDESILSLRELEETVARMQRQLNVLEAALRRTHRLLSGGGMASDVVKIADVARVRTATSMIMYEIQGARHRAQRAQFQLAAAEGTTMAAIARSWGVSRQLVSRMVKEPVPRRRRA
jgi:ParB-like chromosome segregation protein Spo0J